MKAVLPVFDESGKRPLYLQLYDYLKEAILSGDIAEGERLPSLRSLTRSTGLSLTTIEKAYNQLLVEGYIRSRAASGYYAARVASTGPETVPVKKGSFDQKLSSDAGTGAAAGIGTGAATGIGTGSAAGTGTGAAADEVSSEPTAFRFDPDCFDFNKWKKCMNRVLTYDAPSLFFEGSPQGEIALRREIARYLYRSRGVTCSPDQIFMGAGTQQITGLLATILKNLRIEHVALENPGYAPVRNTFRDRGFAITDVEVLENGLALEKLPVNVRSAAYVSPSNHSFTGAVMPIGRRYEMIRWAIANDSYIIEDDYDSELRYFGRPIPPIKSLADDDRVIYLGSFSSTLFAAVRISYMVLPPRIAEEFAGHLAGYSQTCSKLEQLTLAMFMETGLYQTHLRKLRKLYAQKLARAVDVLRRDAADFVAVRNTASGLSLLLEVGAPEGGKKKRSKARPAPKNLIRDAESLGIPAAGSGELILLYYNQIPLSEIDDVFRRLIDLWRR